ncbi:hypothetical protein [Marivita sp.]|uniref:hypothetical protein n=1 Tax=Marivita sp. TaxID=2003365 RepID=UPI003A89BF52
MPTIIDYARMSSGAYDANPSVPRWTAADPMYEPNSGLRTVIYTDGSVFVVAFRGTDNASDLVEDAQLTLGMNTAMYPIGEAIASGVSAHGPVYVTGHSLGGAVAQVVGSRMGLPFVTFNAPSVAILASRNMWQANYYAVQARAAGAVASAIFNPRQAMRDVQSAFSIANGKNYRLSTDVVSNTGIHYGDVITLPAGTANPLDAHRITTMISVLGTVSSGNLTFPR